MKLKELADIKKGKYFPDSELVDTKPYGEVHYSYLTIDNLINGIVEKFITKKNIEKANVWVGTILLKYGDYLLFQKNSEFQIVSFLDNEPTVIGQGIWVIRPQNIIAEQFFGYENNRQYFVKEIQKNKKEGLELNNFITEINILSAPENVHNSAAYERRKILNNSDFPIKLTSKPIQVISLEIPFSDENEFQKKKNTWNNGVKSRFIEALIARLPIPNFYFDATYGGWLIMDGFQQLNAIFDFYQQKFALNNLDFLTELEGKTFHQLPRQYQKNIEEYTITAHILEKGNSHQAKYKILKNINSDKPHLTAQEIRYIACERLSLNSLKKVAQQPWFKTLVPTRDIDSVNMYDREIVLRYVAFQEKNYKTYTPSIVDFLDDVMIHFLEMPSNQYEKYKQQLFKVLTLLFEIFGVPCFSRSCFDKKGAFYIHNNIIFELLTYGFSLIINDIQNIGMAQKNIMKKEIITFFEEQTKKISYFWEEDYAYSKKGLQERFDNMEIFIKNLTHTIYDK